MTKQLRLLTTLLLAASAARAAAAPTGTAFTYQGRVLENGTPPTGSYDLELTLYDVPAGGASVLPPIIVEDVAVSSGLFTVSLDFGAAAFTGEARFMQIGVRPGASTGSFTLLSGRQELRPTPNALAAPWAGVHGKPAGFADDVDNDALGALSCVGGDVAKWNGSAWACAADANSGGDITAVTAGAGLSGGGATGAVSLQANFGGTGAATTVSRSDHNHFGQTWTGAGTWSLRTVNSGTGNVNGLRAEVTDTGATSYAVYGITESTVGRGVVGRSNATTGVSLGVYGVSASSIGHGMFGEATATTGSVVGVGGYINSDDGAALDGFANASNGTAVGVIGSSNGDQGVGVYGGAANNGSTYGVYGWTSSTAGTSVFGWNQATSGTTYGVRGLVYSSAGRAVYGLATSGTGYAGYFSGRVNVTGTLTKGAGAFKIDHPLDPQNKYLYHSFVESPDMKNVYDGTVVTDAEGYATVELPDWFEALNRDFRYQLTVIEEGEAFVLTKVARKIQGNRFVVRTSQPGIEISWQVTGIRRDPYAEKNRIPLEEVKPEAERGRYLHPAAYGAPDELGEDNDPAPARPPASGLLRARRSEPLLP